MDSITKALMSEFVGQFDLAMLPEDQQFEHFATHSIVASRFKDEFDTTELVVGGGNDLGIDAFAVIVNGRIVDDAEGVTDLLNLNGYLDVEFVIVQAKRSSKFEGSALIALGDNLANAVFSDEEAIPFNDDIKRLIEIRRRVYSSAARLRGNPECRVFYVTTGTWNGDAYLQTILNRKSNDLLESNLFSHVRFEPIGAQRLQDLYRSTRTSIRCEVLFEKFVVLPSIDNINSAYLGVLPATEYIKLITDEDGNILKSVFVDNVRDFQGENAVNLGITQTITAGKFDQFALRNNGVTVVAREIATTGNKFTLKDYQIVNGCQTSHVLFAQKDILAENLLVPIKLIFTEDEEVTQEIIKSTNRQTPIDENDLLALTQFQRNLEDYYAGFSQNKRLYYERRSKQYSNQSEVEKSRIIPVGMQLKFFASMFLDAPHQAGRYQGTLLASVKDRVFRETHKPEPYYTSALAFNRFEPLLRRLHPDYTNLRSFKFHYLAAFRHRFENSALPDFGDRRIISYCENLNSLLWDADNASYAFEQCSSIIESAAKRLNVSLVRDSSKTRDFTDAVREEAILSKEKAGTRS